LEGATVSPASSKKRKTNSKGLYMWPTTALNVANHLKTKNRRHRVVADVDDTRQCPFVEHYDGNLHDVLANLRRLDGSIEMHPQYGPPVNLFALKGTRKYWVKASTPVLG
jgi:hypothetical protein